VRFQLPKSQSKFSATTSLLFELVSGFGVHIAEKSAITAMIAILNFVSIIQLLLFIFSG
jgi:hypothetical protein